MCRSAPGRLVVVAGSEGSGVSFQDAVAIDAKVCGARLAASNFSVSWVPSQNGFVPESPHSKSGFTRVVDRMEEAGLVLRVRPQHDRRSILVVRTENGR